MERINIMNEDRFRVFTALTLEALLNILNSQPEECGRCIHFGETRKGMWIAVFDGAALIVQTLEDVFTEALEQVRNENGQSLDKYKIANTA